MQLSQSNNEPDATKFVRRTDFGFVRSIFSRFYGSLSAVTCWLNKPFMANDALEANGQPSQSKKRIDAIVLEDRILYSASPLSFLGDVGEPMHPQGSQSDAVDDFVFDLFASIQHSSDSKSADPQE